MTLSRNRIAARAFMGVPEQISPQAPCALVVDDDTLILMDAIHILEDAGFCVRDATNVADALALLDQLHGAVDLLFTDVHMPGDLDGFALARRVAERWPHIAIVVASGLAKPEPGDLPEGAAFIGKPFSADLVYEHISEMMPRERQPAPLRRRDVDRPT